MDRLLTMDKEQFVSQIQAEVRRILEQVADAVNNAPQGSVISGSEVQVRDLMAELRQKVFQTAVQMRIDSTESSFSPSEGHQGKGQAEQRAIRAQHAERQRADRSAPDSLVRRGRGQRLPAGPAGAGDGGGGERRGAAVVLPAGDRRSELCPQR